MALTPEQFGLIRDIASDMDAKQDQLKSGVEHVKGRLTSLAKAELYIEELIISAQMLEHMIRFALNAKRAIERMKVVAGESFPNTDLRPVKDNQTLGELVRMAEDEGFDDELLTRLRSFNKKWRIEFVHKVFDGKHDVPALNEEARKYLHDGEEFDSLMLEVYGLAGQAGQEAVDLVNKHKG